MASSSPPPSREPSDYRPGVHFAERFKDCYEDDRPPRHLDGDIVNGCIERGTVRRVERDIVWFRETFGGATYRLVVDVEQSEVVTGYPVSINTEVARASGRWSSQQIADIREFIATDPR